MVKKVLKFGGTSVGTIERIQHVANIIKKEVSDGNKIIAYNGVEIIDPKGIVIQANDSEYDKFHK